MKDIRDTETILQMIIRMRIEVVEKLIQHKEEEIKADEEKLKDPEKYNTFFIQHGISHSKGYLSGLKYTLESLTEIQKQVKQ